MKRAAWLALPWLLGAGAMLASVAGGALLASGPSMPDSGLLWPIEILLLVVMMLPGIGYSFVGALVISRRRSNAVAWILLVIGSSWALQLLVLGLRESPMGAGVIGGAILLAWIGSWVWMISSGLAFMFLPLLYPDGHLLSRRWRPLAIMAGVLFALQVGASAFAPGPLGADASIDNPFALRGAVGELLGVFSPALFGMLPFAAFTLIAVASLVIRFTRSRGLQRQQIKWLAYAAGVTAVLFLLEAFVLISQAISFVELPLYLGDVLFAMVIAGFGSLSVAAGIAILRHRLYDIDLLINRTLVYGILTVGLAAVYVGSVIALQGLLSGIAGGGALAVAASTLAVAALFQPMRRRIQRGVDRRFYRSRYDAARTVEAFSSRLRQEVDLGRLTDDLREVVDHALQPAGVSVWLRRQGS